MRLVGALVVIGFLQPGTGAFAQARVARGVTGAAAVTEAPAVTGASAAADGRAATSTATSTEERAPRLTLREALEEGLAHAPQLAAAVRRADGARTAAGLEGPLPNPTIAWESLGLGAAKWTTAVDAGGASAAGSAFAGAGAGTGADAWGTLLSPTGLPDTTVSITQPLPLGPRRGRLRDVARAQASVAAAEQLDVRLSVQLTVIEAYLGALRAAQQQAAIAEVQAAARELARMLRGQVAEGLAAEGDLRRLDAELARLDLRLVRVDLDRRQALARLCAWLQRPACAALTLDEPALPSIELTAAATTLAAHDAFNAHSTPVVADVDTTTTAAAEPATPAASTTAALDALIDAAIERRPDIAIARARVDEARAAQRLGDASRIPDLSLVGGYSRAQGLSSVMAGAAITLPLFDRQGAARARAAADADAAQHELAGARRQARAAIVAQLDAARALHAQARAAQNAAMAPADDARTAARTAFREGAVDLIRLLDAERLHADTMQDVIAVRIDALFAAYRARLTLGQEVP